MIKSNVPSLQDATPSPAPARHGVVAESGENYLETIYLIKERNTDGIVRAVDVANFLGFSKPSVSRALGLLKEKGFIIIEDNGAINFTPDGRILAEAVFERHKLLTVFLHHVANVSLDIAEKDACRIEHVISQETVDGIKEYLAKNNLQIPQSKLNNR